MLKILKKYNIGYKLLAVLMAVGFWFYVMGVYNPNKNLTINNVVINYVGENQMLAKYGYEIIDGKQSTLSVTIKGKRSDIINISADDIIAQVDLSKITSPGKQRLPCKIIMPKSGIEIVNKDDMYITVFADRMTEVKVNVIAQIDGSAKTGYTLGTPVLSPSTVTVKGPNSEVSNISYAKVTADTGVTDSSYYGEKDYTLINNDGNEFTSDYAVKMTGKIKVTVPVLLHKEVSLKVSLHETGSLSADNVAVAITPSEIEISGERTAVESINSITLGTISLDQIKNGYDTTMPIVMPDGITNITGITSADVSVSMINITTKTFTVTNFEILNAPDGKKVAVVEKEMQVTIKGSASFLETLKASDISLVADMIKSSTYNGTKKVTAQVVINKPQSGASAVGTYTVHVKVSGS